MTPCRAWLLVLGGLWLPPALAQVADVQRAPQSNVLSRETAPPPVSAQPQPGTASHHPEAQENLLRQHTQSPPGDGATGPQPHLLQHQTGQQDNLLQPERAHLQAAPGGTPPPVEPSPPAADAQPAIPNEAALWRLLDAARYDELDADLQRLRQAYPGWTPPAELLEVRRQKLLAGEEERLWKLLEQQDQAGLDAAIQRLRAAHPGWEPPQDMRALRAQSALGRAEAGLWALLRRQRYAALDDEIRRLRGAYPEWRPPAKLLALKAQAQQSAAIEQAVRAQDWTRLLRLAQTYPRHFTCRRVDWLWALAQAWLARGRPEQTAAVYRRIVPACPHAGQRLATLHQARAHLAREDFAELLAREEQDGQRDAASERQLQDLRYALRLQDFLQAAEAEDYPQTLALLADIEAGLRQRRDAGIALLAAWAYANTTQPDAARAWFEQALDWDAAREDAHYGLAGLAFQQGRLDEAEAALRRTALNTPAQQALLGELTLAKARAAYADGRYADSLAYLDEAGKLGKDGRDSLLLRAWDHFKLAEYARAEAAFRAAYQAEADAESGEGLVLSLERQGRLGEAEGLAESGPARDAWRKLVAERSHARKLFLAGEDLAPGHYPHLANIAAPSAGAGVQVRDKSRGDEGLSTLRILKLPVLETGLARAGAHALRLRLERVDLDSGDLPPRAMLGSAPLSQDYRHAPATTLRGGWEPRLSYVHEGWLSTYASLGLTPSGAALPGAPLGNAGLIQQTERGYWQAEAFAEPLRDSLLSYTGLNDPYSGANWGRVRRFGLLLGGYQGLDADWGVSGKLRAAALRGEGVADNHSFGLDLDLSKSWRNASFEYLTLGPALTYETFAKNLSHFTLGHGGYFSPQYRLGAGLSTNFLTHEARAWMLKGHAHLGFTSQREDASPCFPLDAALAAASSCGGDYAAARSSGPTFSARLTGAWRLTPGLQLGFGLEVRRGSDYDDRAGMLFLRWQFAPRRGVLSSDLPDALFEGLF